MTLLIRDCFCLINFNNKGAKVMRIKNEDENIEIDTYIERDLDICIDIDIEIKNHILAMTLWLELF